MNRLTVIGRIVRDIKLREVGDGRLVTNNSLAIQRVFKTDNGKDVDFINFVAWGKRAELLEEYCGKGDLVGFDGRIQSRSYLDDDEKTIYTVEMVVESIHFLQNNREDKQQVVQDTQEDIPTEIPKEIETANGTKKLHDIINAALNSSDK